MFNKIVNILVITVVIIMVNCCAVTRNKKSVIYNNETNNELLFKVKENNIGKESFVIQKLSVSYDLNGERKRFNGNLKHDENGDILISIRIAGGIEVARIYLDRDSVRINDRVNKIYKYGRTDRIIGKYGFSYEDIYLLFGDLPEMFKENDIGLCEQGFSESKERYYDNYSISTRINCEEKKVTGFSLKNAKENLEYSIYFDKIKSGEDFKMAEKIYLKYPKVYLTAEIELKGFKIVNVQNMKFNPGSGYKYELLK